MKRLGKRCIDCGCEAAGSIVDEVKPMFRMEIVHFPCGAEFKSVHTANGNVGRATHSGCTCDCRD
jgi:hypothetical protein